MIYPIVSYFLIWFAFMIQIVGYLVVAWVVASILSLPIRLFVDFVRDMIDH